MACTYIPKRRGEGGAAKRQVVPSQRPESARSVAPTYRAFRRCINHPTNMICWHKVVQHHGKQCASISSLASDATNKKRCLRQKGDLLTCVCLKGSLTQPRTPFLASGCRAVLIRIANTFNWGDRRGAREVCLTPESLSSVASNVPWSGSRLPESPSRMIQLSFLRSWLPRFEFSYRFTRPYTIVNRVHNPAFTGVQ